MSLIQWNPCEWRASARTLPWEGEQRADVVAASGLVWLRPAPLHRRRQGGRTGQWQKSVLQGALSAQAWWGTCTANAVMVRHYWLSTQAWWGIYTSKAGMVRHLHCLPSLCCPRSPSHCPSTLPRSITYPPFTYVCYQHPSSRTLLIHSLHVSKPSRYSLIHFTRKLHSYSSSFAIFTSPITIFIRDTPTKFLKHFISKTFTFLLSALLMPNE